MPQLRADSPPCCATFQPHPLSHDAFRCKRGSSLVGLNALDVPVAADKAQFEEFTNPKSENSWDVAMLALAADSNASYVALPLADVPKLGDWLDTTAWKDASVE